MSARRIAAASVLAFAACGAPGSSGSQPTTSGRILHARLIDGGWQIFDHDLSSGESRQLTRTVGDKRYPVRTDRGDVLVHTSNQRPIVVEASSGVEREILPDAGPVRDVVGSPDGQRLVFARIRTDLIDASNLWLADFDGDPMRMLTDEPGIQCHPAWSPDGSRLAFVSGQGYGTYEIWTSDRDGGDRRMLTQDATHDFFPAWSPDGRRIAFSSDRSGDYELWLMNSDGTEPRRLTQSPGLDSRPSWSPDGRELAFTTNRSGVLEIWLLDVETGDARRAFDAKGDVCDPWWH